MGLPMYIDPDDDSCRSVEAPQQAATQDVRRRIENELTVSQTSDDRSQTRTSRSSIDVNQRPPNQYATFTPPLRIVQDVNNLRSLYPTLTESGRASAETRSTHDALTRQFNRLDYLQQQVGRLQLRDAQLRDLLGDVEDALSSSRSALSFIASAIQMDQPITTPYNSRSSDNNNDLAEHIMDAESVLDNDHTDETLGQADARTT